MKLRSLVTAILLIFPWILAAAALVGPNTSPVTVAASGSPSGPSPGAANWGFVAVAEPMIFAIFAVMGLLVFAVWRHGNRRGWVRHGLLRRLE